MRPWPGYEAATATGIVEPWFVHTPRSLWLTRITFAALALVVVGRTEHHRLGAATALWTGAAAGIAFVYATTSMRHLAGGWLGFVFYPLRLVLPILTGALAATVISRLRARA